MKNVFALPSIPPEMADIAAYDRNEIDHPDPSAFSRLSYWDRLHTILDLARRHAPPAGTVTELGCAQGNASLLLAEAGFQVTAVDLNPVFLCYSKLKYERGRIIWHEANIEDTGIAEASQDFVILGEVVEHCAYPERIVAMAFSLLRPGGCLLITTPNHSFLGAQRLPSFSKILLRGSRVDLQARQYGPDGRDHLFLFAPEELRHLCPAAGRIVAFGYLCNALLGKVPRLALQALPSVIAAWMMRSLSHVPGLNRKTSSGLYLLIQKPIV